jgi:hypothetical protein
VRGQLTAIFEMMCVGRVLVVLDDVWLESIHAAKLLRRAAPTGAKVLITTRNEQVIHELDGGEAIALDELPEADAKALLTSLTASHRLIRPEDRDRLYGLIGGHPLALEIAAATLKTAKDRTHMGRILDSAAEASEATSVGFCLKCLSLRSSLSQRTARGLVF